MKTSALVAIATFGLSAVAFPSNLLDRNLDEEQLRHLSRLAADIEHDVERSRGLEKRVGFDAKSQYVSNMGDHAFQPPGPNDLRGPCPGLNAMANHGYLPRNGVATITQFIQANYKVFGMGIDLGAFLAVYGSVFDGDLTSWSIGGAPPSGLLGGVLDGVGLLGKPRGISNSHNVYESDVSPTRGDLYQYGESYSLQLSQFEDLYSQKTGENGYGIPTITEFRAKRFQQSIKENPNFFNAPFTGVIVLPAAYTFIYRFMGNKSAEYPEGYLDGETLKTFYSVTGEPGNFKYVPGHERIPDNWYKRAIGDEYGLVPLAVDILAAALEHPEFLSIGGNTGEVDSFTGVDIDHLTKGVFNAETLLQGNNLVCFAYQAAQQAAPDILRGLFSTLTKPLSQLTGAIDKALVGLNCPKLEAIDKSQLKQFPGAKGM